MVDLPSYGPAGRIRLGSFLRSRPLLLNYEGDEKLIDFQVKCALTSSDIPFEKLRADKQDLLFVDNNNEAIPYWIEKADSTEIIVWLKFSEVIPGKEAFWLYYGNGNFLGASDGDTVFDFFDDFEDYTEKWQEGGDSPTVSSETVDGRSVVKITNGGTNCGGLETKQNINVENRVIERLIKGWTDTGNDDVDECICIDAAWETYAWCSHNLMHGLFDLEGGAESHGLEIGGNGWKNLGTEQLSATAWKRVITIIETGEITGICGDEEISETGTPSTYEGKLMLSVDNNQNNAGVYYDWIFVRKYTEPEPSVSVG